MPPNVYNFRDPVEAVHRLSAGWHIDSGAYALHVGRSAADIAHVVEIDVDGRDAPLSGSTPLDKRGRDLPPLHDTSRRRKQSLASARTRCALASG